MNLQAVLDLLTKASQQSGHKDFVVIGSLSILALEGSFDVPEGMTMSNDIDCYTKSDPGRIFDLVATLGEDSPHHQQYGYFLDAVSPMLPCLPEGWEQRLNKVSDDGITVWFLDPNDAALSKYARGEERDLRWIREGIRSGVISLPIVRARFKDVTFLDPPEQERARALIDQDSARFKQR